MTIELLPHPVSPWMQVTLWFRTCPDFHFRSRARGIELPRDGKDPSFCEIQGPESWKENFGK